MGVNIAANVFRVMVDAAAAAAAAAALLLVLAEETSIIIVLSRRRWNLSLCFLGVFSVSVVFHYQVYEMSVYLTTAVVVLGSLTVTVTG